MKISHDKDSWAASGILRRDFRNGYHPEDDEDTPHKSKGKGRGCKRSKDREHDFSAKRYGMVWTSRREWVDGQWVDRRGYEEKQYTVCAKCGKPLSYMWRWGR